MALCQFKASGFMASYISYLLFDPHWEPISALLTYPNLSDLCVCQSFYTAWTGLVSASRPNDISPLPLVIFSFHLCLARKGGYIPCNYTFWADLPLWNAWNTLGLQTPRCMLSSSRTISIEGSPNLCKQELGLLETSSIPVRDKQSYSLRRAPPHFQDRVSL